MVKMMSLVRSILWRINYGDKRRRYEMLCHQSYEIAKLECGSDKAYDQLERWKHSVVDLFSDNMGLVKRFGKLSFEPTAGVLTKIDPPLEWKAEDWKEARELLSEFASMNGKSRQN